MFPLALLPVLFLARVLRRRPESAPRASATMTHEQAADARRDIDEAAAAEIDAIHGRAEEGRDALRNKFGGR